MSFYRYTIHAKDIAIVEGLKPKSAAEKLTAYRNLHKKERHQPLSIKEYCKYLGFDYEHFMQQYKDLFSIEVRNLKLTWIHFIYSQS